MCVKKACDILNCKLRHPVNCKFYKKYKRCKFDPCSYKHSDNDDDLEILKQKNKAMLEKLDKIEKDLESMKAKERASEIVIDKLKVFEDKFENIISSKMDEISKLENIVKDADLKVLNLDKKIDTINKKLSVLQDREGKLADKNVILEEKLNLMSAKL